MVILAADARRRAENYRGHMATNMVNPILGSTASCAVPAPRSPGAPPGPGAASSTGPTAAPADAHPRHRLGDALRAIGVFLDTAFRVVVLGTDGTKPGPQPGPKDPGAPHGITGRGRSGRSGTGRRA